jgi:hypothetical protein
MALAVLALRQYAQGGAPAAPFQATTNQALKDLGVKPAVARRLVDNYDKISAKTRKRFIGPLGLPGAKPPQTVAKRDPKALVPQAVSLPGVLVQKKKLKLLQDAAAGVGQVLAPNSYGIHFKGMHCVDETHADALGSDKVYIITSALNIKPDGTNVLTTLRHPLVQGIPQMYEDVDSHETRVGPVASCWNANVPDIDGGVSVTTAFFEHDFGDPDHYRDEIEALVVLAISIAILLFPGATKILLLIQASGLVTDFFNWLLDTGDDEIGTTTTVLEEADLEVYSRTRLTELSLPDKKKTGLKNHYVASVNDRDYFAAFEVTRKPKADFLPGPVVE